MRLRMTAVVAAMAVSSATVGWLAGRYVADLANDDDRRGEVVDPLERSNVPGTDGASGSIIHQLRPDFRLPDLSGRQRSPDEWAGRILIVNFWATWCAPCREEIPMLIELHQRHRPAVQVIGIAIDNVDSVRAFASELGIDYPLLIDDSRGATMRRYGNRLGALPFTAVVAKDGVVVYVRLGLLERGELDGVVDALL